MTTRAALRPVEPGNDAVCVHCGQPVKFAARTKPQQVIANVYIGGAWARVEHYHESCYDVAGSPHGPAIAPAPFHRAASVAMASPASADDRD